MLTALDTTNSPFNERQIQAIRQGLDTLNTAQAAWLSGYLAGRLTVSLPAALDDGPQAIPAGAVPTAATVLNILYASQTGNGQQVAESLSRQAAAVGLSARLQSLDGFRPAALKKLRQAAIVISTHGDGDPPDDAIELFEFLAAPSAPDLGQLEFRILALGDRSYPEFCAAGRKLESLLQARGARPFAPRVECDLDYEAAAAAWAVEVIEHGAQRSTERITDQPRLHSREGTQTRLSVVPVPSGWSRQRPFSATVQRVQKITGLGSDKDVHHVELSLEGSGISYEPGDSLGVWSRNPEALVSAVLEGLAIDQAARVEYGGTIQRMDEWLARERELTRLTQATVEAFSAHTKDGALQRRINNLDATGKRAFLEQRQFIDLVQEFPAAMTPTELLGLLRPQAPRFYSIASSQQVVGEEVHLTVVTRYSNATGQQRCGLASGMLNHGLRPGDEVSVFPEPNPRFRLPEDRDTPLILVAAGTGIAPYRAFLQQLEDEKRAPDIWLIYGNPRLRSDFLYQREWLRWRSSGLLRRIDGAFSRDQAHKRYVQHVVTEHAGELVAWLQRGARLYLCGGLEMGRAVEQAVQDAFVRQGAANGADAVNVLATLRHEKRLLKDLY